MAVHDAKGCFVWAALCLAGRFNPSHPTGALQQRHRYKPFLRIKPVVTFFFSAEFSTRDHKAGRGGAITRSSSSHCTQRCLHPRPECTHRANGLFRHLNKSAEVCWDAKHPRCHQKFKSDLCPAHCRLAADISG